MTNKFNKKHYILEKKNPAVCISPEQTKLADIRTSTWAFGRVFIFITRASIIFWTSSSITYCSSPAPLLLSGLWEVDFLCRGATLCFTRQACSLIQPQRLNIRSPFRRMLNRLLFGGSAKPFWLYYYCCYWTVTFIPKETAVSAAPWVLALWMMTLMLNY